MKRKTEFAIVVTEKRWVWWLQLVLLIFFGFVLSVVVGAGSGSL